MPPTFENDLLARRVMTNPVGTETAPLPGAPSMGMQRWPFDPIVDPSIARWPGRPMTEGEYQNVRNASLDLFNQAAMLEGGGPTVPRQVSLASRRVGTPGPPRAVPGGDNALMPGTAAPGMTAGAPGSPFDFRPASGRALPRNNYLTTLDTHAPLMFREAAPWEAAEILPGTITKTGPMEKFLADNPDVALGQGANKGGVQLAFDASKLEGQISSAKPAWGTSFQSGAAEYIGKGENDHFRGALAGVRVPDTLNLTKGREGMAVNRGLQELLSKGWTKRSLDNGFTEYLPPGARK